MATIKDGKIVYDDTDFGGITIRGIDVRAPYQKMWKWAYRRHDLQYQLYKPLKAFGKNRGKSKIKIDFELFSDMIRISKSKFSIGGLSVAPILYSIVATLGIIVWNNGQWILYQSDIKQQERTDTDSLE